MTLKIDKDNKMTKPEQTVEDKADFLIGSKSLGHDKIRPLIGHDMAMNLIGRTPPLPVAKYKTKVASSV
jgi:hypothetical protein